MCEPISIGSALTALGSFTAANAIPVTLAQAGVGIASSLAQAHGQQQAYTANRREAVSAFADDIEALNARADETNRSATDNLFQNEVQALQERGRARAAATGTADVSLNEVLQNVGARKAQAKGSIIFNRDTAIAQNMRSKRSADAAKASRIASVAKPSMIALGFDVLGQTLGAATTYSELKNRGANQGGN